MYVPKIIRSVYVTKYLSAFVPDTQLFALLSYKVKFG